MITRNACNSHRVSPVSLLLITSAFLPLIPIQRNETWTAAGRYKTATIASFVDDVSWFRNDEVGQNRWKTMNITFVIDIVVSGWNEINIELISIN